MYVGVPTGEFSTDLVLYGVPRRATGLEIRNELISLGLSRLTEGTFVRQGADMHVCIKLDRSLPMVGDVNIRQIADLKHRLSIALSWRVLFKQCARRPKELGPPLPLELTTDIGPQWTLPSGNREMRVATFNARGLTKIKQKI